MVRSAMLAAKGRVGAADVSRSHNEGSPPWHVGVIS
jgi:hypothetical protein